MSQLKTIILEADLRTEIADAHLHLANFGLARVKRKISTPEALGILAGSGMLIGLLRRRPASAGQLKDLEKELHNLKAEAKTAGPPLVAEAAADFSLGVKEWSFGLVSSIATSLAARYAFAKFFTDQEPEFEIDAGA